MNEGRDCPVCDCSNSFLIKWNEFREELEVLQEKKISKDVLNHLKELTQENINLKSKLFKLEEIFDFSGEFLRPILKAYYHIHEVKLNIHEEDIYK
ncbi:MAG TPA: hypothetical protein VK590_08800 [Saprospiraceae bacterium]|nr:hypothetical protein [Saprospiraceae bacterium]